MARPPTILLLAGEASGDQHGAPLARALRRRWPDCRLVGLGGERMAEEGVELLAALEQLAVMGFVEVLGRLPFFVGLERRINRILASGDVDLVLPIDYPGFNLRVTRTAHSLGIPVLYYIAPQVWAWKAKRAERIAREVDHLAVILPFEEEIFQQAGARVSFVGHPLVDEVEEDPYGSGFRDHLGLPEEAPLLALFPGSREQELRRHLDLFVSAAEELRRSRPDLRPVLARAPGIPPERFAGSPYPVTKNGAALLRHSRAALVKSGTSTLQAALSQTPFVTVYKTNPVTFMLAKRLVRVPHVALANLVAGREVVPELLQHDATPERIVRELLPLVDDGPQRDGVIHGLAQVRDSLGTPGAAERVAGLAAELLSGREEKAR